MLKLSFSGLFWPKSQGTSDRFEIDDWHEIVLWILVQLLVPSKMCLFNWKVDRLHLKAKQKI